MRLTLAFQGSRGDVQPGIALAVELESRCHDVVLAVPPNLVDFAARSGLDARPCGVDTAELLRSPTVERDIKSRNPRRRLAAVTEMTVGGGRITRTQLLAYAQGSEVLVGSSVGQESALDVADRVAIPYVPVHFCPVRRNGVASILPLPSSSPAWLHRAGWTALDRTLSLASRRADNALRCELGLPPVSSSIAVRLARSGVTEIQAYDPLLFPGLDAEWGATRPLIGFLRPDLTTRSAIDGGAALPNDVRRWIESGTPPVYVGFGSMAVPGGPTLIETIVAAVRRTGRRVIVSGDRNDVGVHDSVDVLAIGSVDHAALFPLCEAVIHHGGAGSTAAGLRAGRPTLVCHVGADQPMWGRRLTAAGVGASIAATAATPSRLDSAVNTVLSHETCRAAAALGKSLVPDVDAVRGCADLIEARVGGAQTRRMRTY